MSYTKKIRQILASSGTQDGIYSMEVRSCLVYSVYRRKQAKCWVGEWGVKPGILFQYFFYGIKNNNEGIIKLMIQHQEVELFHKLLQILCLFQYRNQQI